MPAIAAGAQSIAYSRPALARTKGELAAGRGTHMIGAGTFINPLLKIVTVVAVLAATYIFIVEPILDTTESISSDVNDSIGQSLESTNDQIDQALDQAGAPDIPQSSQDSIKEAQRLLTCIQLANGNVDKIQRCNR
jgi:hypothetical protein